MWLFPKGGIGKDAKGSFAQRALKCKKSVAAKPIFSHFLSLIKASLAAPLNRAEVAFMAAEVQCASAHCEKHALHVFIHSIRRFPHALRPCLLTLLPIAILSFTYCSSSSGGGGDEPTDPAVYTCTNGTPSDGSPDGDSDVESCASCDTGFRLVGVECSCTPGDTELLSSTLSIGTCTLSLSGGDITDWGYGTGDCDAGGSLSNDSFEIDGRPPYTIEALLRVLNTVTDPDENALILGVGGVEVPRNIVLQLDSDEFTFADARTPGDSYRWDDPGLTWTSGDLAVKIIERIICP